MLLDLWPFLPQHWFNVPPPSFKAVVGSESLPLSLLLVASSFCLPDSWTQQQLRCVLCLHRVCQCVSSFFFFLYKWLFLQGKFIKAWFLVTATVEKWRGRCNLLFYFILKNFLNQTYMRSTLKSFIRLLQPFIQGHTNKWLTVATKIVFRISLFLCWLTEIFDDFAWIQNVCTHRIDL